MNLNFNTDKYVEMGDDFTYRKFATLRCNHPGSPCTDECLTNSTAEYQLAADEGITINIKLYNLYVPFIFMFVPYSFLLYPILLSIPFL